MLARRGVFDYPERRALSASPDLVGPSGAKGPLFIPTRATFERSDSEDLLSSMSGALYESVALRRQLIAHERKLLPVWRP